MAPKGDDKTAKTADNGDAPEFVEFDLDTFASDLAKASAESQKAAVQHFQELTKQLAESVNAGIGAALENIHDPQTDGPEPVRAARFQVTREAPVYTLDGRGPSLVRDAWYAQKEHDDDAKDRIRRFHQQSAEVTKLVASHVAQQASVEFARAQGTTDFANVTTTSGAAVIPPGYRPDLFVPQLTRNRPLVMSASRGTIANATPFVVPTFTSLASTPGDHTEGNAPVEGTLTLSTKTITPGAISGKLPLTREIVDSSNPAIDQIALAAMRENYAQQTEAKMYTLLNGANGVGGTITTGFVPSGAQADTVAGGTGQPLVAKLRGALALYPFRRFGAPDGAVLGQNATSLLASAIDTTNRPLLPSVGAQNAYGLGNAATQGWSIDGIPHLPAWAMTGTAAGDAQVIYINSNDVWAWESPILSFRFEEKSGPQIIELALFGYFGAHVLRPVGLSGMRIT